MRRGFILAILAVFIAVAAAEIYFEENFDSTLSSC